MVAAQAAAFCLTAQSVPGPCALRSRLSLFNQSLVQALKVVGKDAPDRFVRVAERIPGRTKEECQAKFKAMKAAYQAKKQDS